MGSNQLKHVQRCFDLGSRNFQTNAYKGARKVFTSLLSTGLDKLSFFSVNKESDENFSLVKKN